MAFFSSIVLIPISCSIFFLIRLLFILFASVRRAGMEEDGGGSIYLFIWYLDVNIFSKICVFLDDYFIIIKK